MGPIERKVIRDQVRLESQTELNENKLVFGLIKNGTGLCKITTDEKLVDTFVENYGYSIWCIFKNGQPQDVCNYTRISNRRSICGE